MVEVVVMAVNSTCINRQASKQQELREEFPRIWGFKVVLLRRLMIQ